MNLLNKIRIILLGVLVWNASHSYATDNSDPLVNVQSINVRVPSGEGFCYRPSQNPMTYQQFLQDLDNQIRTHLPLFFTGERTHDEIRGVLYNSTRITPENFDHYAPKWKELLRVVTHQRKSIEQNKN